MTKCVLGTHVLLLWGNGPLLGAGERGCAPPVCPDSRMAVVDFPDTEGRLTDPSFPRLLGTGIAGRDSISIAKELAGKAEPQLSRPQTSESEPAF